MYLLEKRNWSEREFSKYNMKGKGERLQDFNFVEKFTKAGGKEKPRQFV